MDTASEPLNRKPGLLSRILKTIWHLFLILLTGIILGGLAYFAFVQLYGNMAQNGQESAARLSLAETAAVEQQAQNNERLEQLAKRLAVLEKQQSQQSEQLSDLQGKIDLVSQALDQQRDMLARLETLEKELANNVKDDAALKEEMTAEDAPLMVLNREVKILKAMTLINRARFNLVQNNAGLAEADINQAYVVLEGLKAEAPAQYAPQLNAWMQRLNLVSENINLYPVVAADDLEITWRLMAAGLEDLPFLPAASTAAVNGQTVTETPTALTTDATVLPQTTPTTIITATATPLITP